MKVIYALDFPFMPVPRNFVYEIGLIMLVVHLSGNFPSSKQSLQIIYKSSMAAVFLINTAGISSNPEAFRSFANSTAL